MCNNYSIILFSLRIIALCRSYSSLLSFPKHSLLQDSLYCVLEFVCVCGCSCAFPSIMLVPLDNMMPFKDLKPNCS